MIEIEKQLANTQASLDSINGVRKALAKETDLVAVYIDFQTAQSTSEQGFFGPVVAAWSQAGSADGLVSFIAVVLPWLVILIPGIWLLRAAWRRWRKQSKEQRPIQLPIRLLARPISRSLSINFSFSGESPHTKR